MRLVLYLCIGGFVAAMAFLIPALSKYNSARDSESSAQRERTLVHNFGVVAPGQTYRHEFLVHNPSSQAWTVENFRTSCNCTVGEISSRTIEPNDDARVTVSYRAPNADADEQREISLTYREPDAPRIVFQIQAQVRKSMVLDTDRVTLEDFNSDRPTSKRILVENYSDIAWSDIRLEQHPEWLAFEAQRRRKQSDVDGPREVWTVDVGANASEISKPELRVVTNLIAIADGEDIAASAPITVTSVSDNAFWVAPERLLFDLSDSNQATQRISLSFKQGVDAKTDPDFSVSHDLGEAMDWELHEVFSRLWNLEFTLDGTQSISGDEHVDIVYRGMKKRIPVTVVE